MSKSDQVSVLELRLHDTLVGHLAGYQDGRNELTFAPEFASNPNRPTFTLTTHPDFPKAEQLLSKPWLRRQRLPPVLSNLLPEGALRELLAEYLKIHIDHEFQLLAWLGQDLPGALVATPLEPPEIPDYALGSTGERSATTPQPHPLQNRFSLAGVQMKFSMEEANGRYRLSQSGRLGDWIVKPPSTRHSHVPLNEYTAMRLAEAAGIDTPEIRLVRVTDLDELPSINLPDEEYAFAIRRFDRKEGARVHMEDFAQVLARHPHEKYSSANYEQIGQIVYTYTGDSLGNAQQLARRLLVNILLANGDAHLKNWSLIYPDQVTPELSPAYDIVTTKVYIEDERQFALNLGKNKNWYDATLNHFQRWSEKATIPWRAIKPQLEDTLERARDAWPDLLRDLPMPDQQKDELRAHWKSLSEDLKIL